MAEVFRQRHHVLRIHVRETFEVFDRRCGTRMQEINVNGWEHQSLDRDVGGERLGRSQRYETVEQRVGKDGSRKIGGVGTDFKRGFRGRDRLSSHSSIWLRHKIAHMGIPHSHSRLHK